MGANSGNPDGVAATLFGVVDGKGAGLRSADPPGGDGRPAEKGGGAIGNAEGAADRLVGGSRVGVEPYTSFRGRTILERSKRGGSGIPLGLASAELLLGRLPRLDLSSAESSDVDV
jgi:hypothetical protein